MTQTSHRVLVIDDDQSFSDALVRWLSQLGYESAVASSAAQGVAHLEQVRFDAVLLDLKLPDVNGHAVIRKVKKSGNAVPIIVVSGTAEIEDILRAWRGEAADFLRKPFHIHDLAATLGKVLGTASVTTPFVKPRPVEAVAGAGSINAAQAVPRVPTLAGQSGRLRATALSDLIHKLNTGALTLPILDPRVSRLPEFLTTQNWTIDDLADTVARDSNLAAGILRNANSAGYARGKELTTLHDACARLGAKAVVALAFEITVKGQFSVPHEPSRTALKNSWRSAVVASRVAPILGEMLALPDREDLRLMSLFHNIGEPLSICLLADLQRQTGASLTAAQLSIQVDAMHEEVGKALATSWKLPSAVIRLAGHHHRPAFEPEPEEERRLRHVILASWGIALRAGFTYFPEQDNLNLQPLIQVLGLSEPQVQPIFEEIKTWQV